MTRQEAIEILSCYYVVDDVRQNEALDMAIEALKQPEIVYCKDCMHHGYIGDDGNIDYPTDNCPAQCDDPFYNWLPPDDWYCAAAMRREDEPNT